MPHHLPSIKGLTLKYSVLLGIGITLLLGGLVTLNLDNALQASRSADAVLPKILEQQRAALNLERLQHFGDLVIYAGDIHTKRQAALAAQALSYQPSAAYTDEVRQELHQAYQVIREILYQVLQSDEADARELIETRWQVQKQSLQKLGNQIIAQATQIQSQALESIAYNNIRLTYIGLVVAILVAAFMVVWGWWLAHQLIHPVQAASQALNALESGQKYQLAPAESQEMATIYQAVDKLAERVQDLHNWAHTDPLTGCANRRYFVDELNRLLDQLPKKAHPLGVAMLDLDHFKQVNDQHGHPVGDLVLRTLVVETTALLPNHALLGRLGGEEFALLLPALSMRECQQICERIRLQISRATERHASLPHVTLSLGLTWCAPDHLPASGQGEVLLQQADQALYQAKHQGRNQVVLAHPQPSILSA